MRIPLLVDCNSRALVFYYIGNGSASFDPSITTSANVNVYWKPDDAPETVTSGTTHNFSYAPSAGSHRCVVRISGGLESVTAIDCFSDSVSNFVGLRRCISLASCNFSTNSFAGKVFLRDISDTCVSLTLNGSGIGGMLADIRSQYTGLGYTYSSIVGSLADLKASAQTVHLYLSTGITPGPIGHIPAIRDIRLYSMWPSLSAAASVDIVIDSMWSARANYTYATPSLQIGGTNVAPTGNYIAPEEGSDWHNDGSKWIPLTPNAKAFDLGNDVNTEGFNTWTITKN